MASFLLMVYDPIAVWSLVAGVVGAVAAIIGAVAAIYAARYAKAAPTKEDLARVERHTAESSHHFKQQSRLGELAAKAQAVSIIVSGENHPSEALQIGLTFQDGQPHPIRIALYNEHGSLFGTAACVRKTETGYAADVPPNDVLRWFSAGSSISSEKRRLKLRVYLSIDGHEPYREVPVILFRGQIIQAQRSYPAHKVEGRV